MKGIMRYGLIAVFALLLNYGVCPVIWAQSLKSPSLSEIVLIGLRPVKELDPANCPKAEQSCVRKYLGTIAPDSILWDFDVPSSPDKKIGTDPYFFLWFYGRKIGTDPYFYDTGERFACNVLAR